MRLTFNKKSFRNRIFFLVALAAGISCQAQMITTFAGTGTSGYNGDDLAATATQLWSPAAIAMTGSGTVYVADGLNNRIRVVTQTGKVSTIAGIDDPGYSGDGGPATDGQLNDPEGVAIDGQGNVYISDKYNHSVRKITPQGTISTLAGNGEAGYSGDGGLATASQLSGPTGLALDNAGNLYIADAGNNRIRKVTVDGKIMTIAGTGNGGFNGNAVPATAAQLNAPRSLVVDNAGNLYIADVLNYQVRKVTPSGIISTIAGADAPGYSGDDSAATAAKLNLPTGIALDKGGNMYIADQGNNCIRKIDTAGIISTVTIINADTAGKLNAPLCIVLDGGSNLYVTEQQNHRIRRITPAPSNKIVKNTTKTKAAGTEGKPYTPPPFSTPNSNYSPAPVRSTGYQTLPTTPAPRRNKG